MRSAIFLALLLATATTAASATEAPNARAAYVERVGLLAANARCGLFTSGMRTALEAGAGQARGALLRAGWSNAQVGELDAAISDAARRRACDDARTLDAAEAARAAFTTWLSAGSMQFPGWQRTWVARRAAGDGWRLSQAIDSPPGAVFGVRQSAGVQQLALVIPIARADAAPARVELRMRDAARARMVETSLPQRVAYGLAAGAPAIGAAASYASTRSLAHASGIGRHAIFVFPDAAFRTLLALDPRESVELRIAHGRSEQRILVEVGDIAAARTFLTIRSG